LVLGAVLGSVIFGAIHCVAWNFEFPTSVERLLWRISCLVTIIVPIPALFSSFIPMNGFVRFVIRFVARCAGLDPAHIHGMQDFTSSGPLTMLGGSIMMLYGLTYTLARIFVVVEVFRGLFFLPPGAFQTIDWVAVIPHVSGSG